VVGCTKWLVK